MAPASGDGSPRQASVARWEGFAKLGACSVHQHAAVLEYLRQQGLSTDDLPALLCELAAQWSCQRTLIEEMQAQRNVDTLASERKLAEQFEELCRTERQIRRSAQIQSALREIAEAAILSTSMQELYALVYRVVDQLLPAKLFHINLLDEETDEIVVPFRADDVNFIPERRPVDKGLTEYIMRLGRAVHISPVELERLRETGEYALGVVQKVQVRHYLGAPLINPQGKAFGVMALILMGNTHSFDTEEVEAFSIIASQVAMAIERKRAQEQIHNLAYYDSLTQLPNRRLLADRLMQAIAGSRRTGQYGALMLVDLDLFKPLNDQHGHAVGDLLLIEVADRLRASVREVDTVARLGGDEFVVVLASLHEDLSISINQARAIAEKILESLSRPYLLTPGNHAAMRIEHHCSASIGVTTLHGDINETGEVLRQADMAMYCAKNAGRSQVWVQPLGEMAHSTDVLALC